MKVKFLVLAGLFLIGLPLLGTHDACAENANITETHMPWGGGGYSAIMIFDDHHGFCVGRGRTPEEARQFCVDKYGKDSKIAMTAAPDECIIVAHGRSRKPGDRHYFGVGKTPKEALQRCKDGGTDCRIYKNCCEKGNPFTVSFK